MDTPHPPLHDDPAAQAILTQRARALARRTVHTEAATLEDVVLFQLGEAGYVLLLGLPLLSAAPGAMLLLVSAGGVEAGLLADTVVGGMPGAVSLGPPVAGGASAAIPAAPPRRVRRWRFMLPCSNSCPY